MSRRVRQSYLRQEMGTLGNSMRMDFWVYMFSPIVTSDLTILRTCSDCTQERVEGRVVCLGRWIEYVAHKCCVDSANFFTVFILQAEPGSVSLGKEVIGEKLGCLKLLGWSSLPIAWLKEAFNVRVVFRYMYK
jgi:hypothetical protein